MEKLLSAVDQGVTSHVKYVGSHIMELLWNDPGVPCAPTGPSNKQYLEGLLRYSIIIPGNARNLLIRTIIEEHRTHSKISDKIWELSDKYEVSDRQIQNIINPKKKSSSAWVLRDIGFTAVVRNFPAFYLERHSIEPKSLVSDPSELIQIGMADGLTNNKYITNFSISTIDYFKELRECNGVSNIALEKMTEKYEPLTAKQLQSIVYKWGDKFKKRTPLPDTSKLN